MCQTPESSFFSDVDFIVIVGHNAFEDKLLSNGHVLEVDVPGGKDPVQVLKNNSKQLLFFKM